MILRSLYRFFLTVFLTSSLSTISIGQILTLDDACRLALKNNPTLLQIEADARAVAARINQNRGLYDWTLNALANYSDREQARVIVFQPSQTKQTAYALGLNKSFGSATRLGLNAETLKTDENSSFNILNKRYESELGFTLSQDLLQNFIKSPERVRLETDKRRNNVLYFSSKRRLELLLYEVQAAYWTLWRNIEFLKVTKQSEKDAGTLYNESRQLLQQGLREQDDVLQAEAAFLSRQEETLTAEMAVLNSWNALRSLIGILDQKNWDETPELDNPPWDKVKSVDPSLTTAFSNRSDYKALEETLSINEKIKESLAANTLPLLTAEGGYSLTGLDPSFGDTVTQIRAAKYQGWNVGMALRHSFGQNLDRSQIDLATSEWIRARADMIDLERGIQRDIENEARRYRLALDSMKLNQQILDRREKIYKAFLRKYQLGRVDMQSLIDIHNQLLQSRIRRRNSEANAAQRYSDVLLAEGRILAAYGLDEAVQLPGEAPTK